MTDRNTKFSVFCYLNYHDWRVTHRTVTYKMKPAGVLGSFLQAIWGPGLGYVGGTFGNYALCLCKRCNSQAVFIEYNEQRSGSLLKGTYSTTEKTPKEVEDIQLQHMQAGKPYLVNLVWKPVETE